MGLKGRAQALQSLKVAHAFLATARSGFLAAPFFEVLTAPLAAAFPVAAALRLPASLPFAAVFPLAGARAAKRGGSPSCFKHRTRPRPMSSWMPPHCGQGSTIGRLKDTQSQFGQFA